MNCKEDLASTTQSSTLILPTPSWAGAPSGSAKKREGAPSFPIADLAQITARSHPVVWRCSLFASEALGAFVEATDAVAASLTHGRDTDEAPPRGGRRRTLRIVDTATGSFGFELEVPAQGADPPAQGIPIGDERRDTYVQAVSTTLSLLDEAARNNEKRVSDLLAEIHPHTATKVRAFAEVLARHDALFAAEFEGHRVRLDSADDVQQVVRSLAEADITEQTEEHPGTLLGELPESRRFEARLAEGGIIQGKVDRIVANIAQFKATWENRESILTLRIIRIRSRTRYVLVGAAEHPGNAETEEPT